MRKIIPAAGFFILFSIIASFNPMLSHAATINALVNPVPIYENSTGDIVITISSDTPNTFLKDADYAFGLWKPGDAPDGKTPSLLSSTYKEPLRILDKYIFPTARDESRIRLEIMSDTAVKITLPLEKPSGKPYFERGQWTYRLWAGRYIKNLNPENLLVTGQFYIYPPQQGNIGLPAIQTLSAVQQYSEMTLVLNNVLPDETYTVYFDGEKKTIYIGKLRDAPGAAVRGDNAAVTMTIPDTGPPQKAKIICLKMGKPLGILRVNNCDYASLPFEVTAVPPASPTILTSSGGGVPEGQDCELDDPNSVCPGDTVCASQPVLEMDDSGITSRSVCLRKSFFSDLSFSSLTCAEGEDKNGNIITKEQIKNDPLSAGSITKCLSVNTAIGPISTEPQGFVRAVFSVVLGLAGGIALILIIISGYKFMTSSGNPEATKAATEQLTSAIIGLLFIIFSFVILQIIGVDILRIPGFGE